MKPKPPDPDDLKLVNCAVCACELLGESARLWLYHLSRDARKRYPPECSRLNDRPHCPTCYYKAIEAARAEDYSSHGSPGHRRGRMVNWEESGSSQDNAIRAMEDNLSNLE